MSFVFVGSKSRLTLPIARWLPASSLTVFVEPSEADSYAEAHPSLRLVVLARNNGGFGFLLNSMTQYALSTGLDHYVFADDDLLGLRYRPCLTQKFTPTSGPEAVRLLLDHIGLAKQNRLAQLALSFAGHSWRAKRATDSSIGAWGCFVSSPQATNAVGGYDEALPIFNDWDLSARLLLAGLPTARTNLLSFLHRMKSQPGGAESIYSRPAIVEQAARTLQSRYGPTAVQVKMIPEHGLVEPRFRWNKLSKR